MLKNLNTKTDPNEKENKKSPTIRAIENNRCSLCSKMKKTICTCGPGGGGGGDEKKYDNTRPATDAGFKVDALINPFVSHADEKVGIVDDLPIFIHRKDSEQSAELSHRLFDASMIAELVAKKIITIENNQETGILTIKFNSHLLSPQQKLALDKFLHALTKEFHDFVKKEGISSRNCSITRADNLLRITLHPTHYEKFIVHLTAKNMLDIKPERKEAAGVSTEQQEGRRFHPTPCSTRLEPKKWNPV